MSKVILFFIQLFFNQIKALFTRSSELGRLVTFFGLAVALSLAISDNHGVAEILFQSPPSPPAQPAPAQQPPAQPPPVQQPPAQQPPAQQPPVQQPPAQQPPAQPQQPQQQPPADPSAGQPQQPAQPAPEFVSPLSPQAPASSSLELPPFPEPERIERLERFEDEAEDPDSSNFILDQVELIDTIVVSTAYVWLCCGIVLFLLIPLVFLFLQIRGRTKILTEENF
jgi:hypothetical protein